MITKNKLDKNESPTILTSTRIVEKKGELYVEPQYIENIARLINNGFNNVIPVVDHIEEVDALIAKLPRGSKKRQALQRLYSTQAYPTSVDLVPN